MAALEACKRSDVHDAVGKEARSMVLKNALPKLAVPAVFGFIDLDALAKQIENATVSVSSAALQSSTGTDLKTVACSANFKFDASSAITGQDVFQINRLRWTIRFADEQPDPASSNFTIEVDPSSLYENMAINGEPLQRILEQQAQEQAAREEREQAAEASRGNDQTSASAGAVDHDPPDAQPTPTAKPASPEELYAPDL